MTLLDVPTRDPDHALHVARAADVVVLCMGPHCSLENRPFDAIG